MRQLHWGMYAVVKEVLDTDSFTTNPCSSQLFHLSQFTHYCISWGNFLKFYFIVVFTKAGTYITVLTDNKQITERQYFERCLKTLESCQLLCSAHCLIHVCEKKKMKLWKDDRKVLMVIENSFYVLYKYDNNKQLI